MLDLDLLEETSDRIYMKKLALQTCIDLIAKTVLQSEFRVRENGTTIKDEMYYRLNVQPNMNQTASEFWQQVIYKLIYDNECLIIQSDSKDLLIADNFSRTEYAVFTDTFSDVSVKNYTFNRVFKRDECIYLRFANESLERLVSGLFEDYGNLFGRIVDFQMRKNQVRASMLIDAIMRKDKETSDKTDAFLERVRSRLEKSSFALFPLQKGVEYNEHSKNQGVTAGVDEVNKVYDGFLEVIAKALSIPVNLLRGDMADIDGQVKNYFRFCIDPLLKIISTELNARVFEKSEYLEGKKLEIRRTTYTDLFDVATAVDKLIAAHMYNPNELRDKLGDDTVDNEEMNRYVRTKNYTDDDGLEGGEEE